MNENELPTEFHCCGEMRPLWFCNNCGRVSTKSALDDLTGLPTTLVRIGQGEAGQLVYPDCYGANREAWIRRGQNLEAILNHYKHLLEKRNPYGDSGGMGTYAASMAEHEASLPETKENTK